MKITDFFLWLAAVDRKILARCPYFETIKYQAIGAAVLIPVISGFYAMRLYAGKHLGGGPEVWVIAAVWALMILTIDRVMLASYRPFAPMGKWVMQILLRMVLVLLTSATIAHPICLEEFRETIKASYQKTVGKRIEEAKNRQENRKAKLVAFHKEELTPLEDRLHKLDADPADEDAVKKLVSQKRAVASGDSPALAAAKVEEKSIADQLKEETTDIATLKGSLQQIEKCIDSERRDGQNECNGPTPKAPGRNFSLSQQRDRNVCPRLAELLGNEEGLKKQLDALNLKLKEQGERRDRVHETVIAEDKKARFAATTEDNLIRDKARQEIEDKKNGQDRERKGVNESLGQMRARQAQEDQQAQDEANDETKRLGVEQKGPTDPTQETIALLQVVMTEEENTASTGKWGWLARLFPFASVFGMLLVIDSFPVVMKILSTGPYERELHIHEERLRLRQEQFRRWLPGHVHRHVQDELAMETRRRLEEIHRVERDRNVANDHFGNPELA